MCVRLRYCVVVDVVIVAELNENDGKEHIFSDDDKLIILTDCYRSSAIDPFIIGMMRAFDVRKFHSVDSLRNLFL